MSHFHDVEEYNSQDGQPWARRRTIWERLCRRRRHPVASVVVWENVEDAKSELSFDVVVPEGVKAGEQIHVREPTTRSMIPVTIPEGPMPGETFKQPKGGHEPYRHVHPFVVVIFASKGYAKAALKRGVRELAEPQDDSERLHGEQSGDAPLFQSDCVVELLNPSWHALSLPRGPMASAFLPSSAVSSRNASSKRLTQLQSTRKGLHESTAASGQHGTSGEATDASSSVRYTSSLSGRL